MTTQDPTPIVANLANNAALVRAYTTAQMQRRQWQAALEALIYEILQLDPENNLNLDEFVPTIDEVQTEMSSAIPYEEKLSDLAVTMREESG